MVFSGSTDGRPIDVVGTSTPGTTIHVPGAGNTDEVWLYATNSTATEELLTIVWDAPARRVEVLVPPDQTEMIIEGMRIDNSRVLSAFGANGSTFKVMGHVNRLI